MFTLSQLNLPVLQAPMVGVSTPALAAAVSNAGGLGAVAAGAMAPDALHRMMSEVQALTACAVNLNLFVQRREAVDRDVVIEAVKKLRPWRDRVGLNPHQTLPAEWYADFDGQLQAAIDCRPAVVSFTFGCLTDDEVERLHRADIFVIGTATTPAEVAQCFAVDVDAVCIQGIEAGGHRGSFTPEAQLRGLPMEELLRDALSLTCRPVIAAGGIMTGADIRGVMNMGAAAAQLGTAFLLTPEAATNAPWRERLKAGGETRLTRAFSGRYARGIVNAYMDEMLEVEQQLPAYPVMNVLTGEIRAAAAKMGNSDCLSLWASTRLKDVRELPAADIIARLTDEMKHLVK
ncbi:MAG: nitronate monooxygenase [Micavibrio sp.]|nr:nitronate monooxygenase [Micavibrio sp.]